jgi:hypothetical protein
MLATRSSPGERFFSTLRADLESRAWAPAPLPGTRQEAESIKRLLPQAQLFLGPEATKQRLLQLPTPGILHVATHGFFLEDAPGPPASRAVVNFGGLGEDARTRCCARASSSLERALRRPPSPVPRHLRPTVGW